jgi:predicted enzyme related to lactoylglutathione lyase
MNDSNPVVHFEMPYQDPARVSEFYKTAFGWKMNPTGEEMGNYVMAETTETENMRPVTPGAINGGFYPKTDDVNPYPSVVISVTDIKQAIENVTKAGGKVLGEPVDIPGIGAYVSFTDSEGNRLSMLQPKM